MGINVKEVTASVCKIHDYVQTLAKLNITHTEFAYLRTIALFGADHHSVEKLQDKAVAELEDATNKKHPEIETGSPDFSSFSLLSGLCTLKLWRTSFSPVSSGTSRSTASSLTSSRWSQRSIRITLEPLQRTRRSHPLLSLHLLDHQEKET